MTEPRAERWKTVSGEVDGVKVEVSLKGDPADVEEVAWQFSVALEKMDRGDLDER